MYHHRKPPFFVFILIGFVVFSLLKFGGFWLLFLLPALFFWFSPRAGSSCGWGGFHDDEQTGKRKEKPKRDVIETADGEYLEVIDEPRSV